MIAAAVIGLVIGAGRRGHQLETVATARFYAFPEADTMLTAPRRARQALIASDAVENYD